MMNSVEMFRNFD